MVILLKTLLKEIRFVSTKIITQRNIMNSSQKMNKIMEDLNANPYYEKYANKIAKMQKTSPEEFINRIEMKEAVEKRRKDEAILKERQYSSVLCPKSSIDYSEVTPNHKRLDDIMKVDLIQDKNAEEIQKIWEQYHAKKDVIAAVIPSEKYKLMLERLQKYPTFIFPLPRSQGYEFIMSQFAANVIHFTPLLSYQIHKENAPECLNIVNYTEFIDNKNIVLMKGEFDKQVIDGLEAQCLANQLQMYYGRDDKNKLSLLESFTNKPNSFKHMDLIKELESLVIV